MHPCSAAAHEVPGLLAGALAARCGHRRTGAARHPGAPPGSASTRPPAAAAPSIKVTNLNASGAGSLKACVDGATPRICVFEVSGTIRLTSDLVIRNDTHHDRRPDRAVAGHHASAAPRISIQASDILIQHIRVRTGDDTNGPDPDNRDSLKLEGNATKPVDEHRHRSLLVQLGHRRDREHLGSARQHHVQQQHLRRAAQRVHPPDRTTAAVTRNTASACCSAARRGNSITMVGNLFAHIVERNPLSRAARARVRQQPGLQPRRRRRRLPEPESGRITKSSVGRQRVPARTVASTATRVRSSCARTLRYSLVSGSRVYVHDNYAPGEHQRRHRCC